MTPGSTYASNLTSQKAEHLYLTGSAQNVPVRHHVVSRPYTWTSCLLSSSGTRLPLTSGFFLSPPFLRFFSPFACADLQNFTSQLLTGYQT